MDYNSTFLGLIVAGVILIAVGFGLVLSQSSMHPAAALLATEKAERANRDAATTVGRIGPYRSGGPDER